MSSVTHIFFNSSKSSLSRIIIYVSISFVPISSLIEFSFSAIIHNYNTFGFTVLTSSFSPSSNFCLKIKEIDFTDEETNSEVTLLA